MSALWYQILHCMFPSLPMDVVALIDAYCGFALNEQLVLVLLNNVEMRILVPWKLFKKHECGIVTFVIRKADHDDNVYLHDLRGRMFETHTLLSIGVLFQSLQSDPNRCMDRFAFALNLRMCDGYYNYYLHSRFKMFVPLLMCCLEDSLYGMSE